MRKSGARRGAIPFHRVPLDRTDRAAVVAALDSGWITTGRLARLFEAEFLKALHPPRAAVAVSSCTAALHLGLALMDLQPGDEVIVPTMTFTASAAAVLMAGATPVIADVDPDTLTLTPESMAARCNRRTKVLMPVHYGGNPARFPAILEFARSHKMRVLDDAAHAFPAKVNVEGRDVQVGSAGLSDATAFSFYATKTVTSAEGGMLTLPAEQEPRARRLTLHGIDEDAFSRSRTTLYHYEVIEHGWKYNLPDLLAALGLNQLRKANRLHAQRTGIAARYAGALAHLVKREWLRLPSVAPDVTSAWHLYPIRLNLARLALSRDAVAGRLRERGIGTSLHYRPLHRHRFWAEALGIGAQRFPAADQAYQELLSLPIWPGLSEVQVGRIASELEGVLQEGGR